MEPGSADLTVEPLGGGKAGHALRMALTGPGTAAIRNDGYWGMDIRDGATYTATVIAKGTDGFTAPLGLRLLGASGQVLAEGQTSELGEFGEGWTMYTVSLKASGTDPKAHLTLSATGPGTVLLDMVSVFPAATFHGRKNGLRPDLAGMLDDLQPAFVRFPGGCWVEGDTMAGAQRWKTTIGPLNERRTQYNLWQYMSGNGLGFHEYLQMCEDLKADALFVINVGMSHHGNVPLEEMDEYVQDALDAIEYANGSASTPWGARRAANGHPAPFNLKYMEIGNENGGPAYNERYPLFVKAIKAKYPEIHLITDVWGGLPTSAPIEIIDEHYYNSPGFFINNAHRYDTYDRKGPKVYVGEYAVTEGCGAGNLAAAVGEAAFMTGMERNSDIVTMSSYAPLFANVNYKKWNPDLINFDSSRCYGTPSYQVQKMFSRNRADVVLPTVVRAQTSLPATSASGCIALATWRTQAEYKDVVVKKGTKVLFSSDFKNGSSAWKPARGNWSVVEGAYRQTEESDDCRSVAGDPSWTDYTLTLKARKIGGAEGFMIHVREHDSRNYICWNLGGWRNSQHAIERSIDGGKMTEQPKPGRIETGRWYDIRIDVKGPRVRCYLDGKLVNDVTQKPSESLFAVAGSSKATGEVIVKVVNSSEQPQATTIKLAGVASVASRGTVTVLTSASGADENTLDEPLKVSPKSSPLTNVKPTFTHTFPARSVTVLRVKASPAK